jgi:trehalose-6-phosphate synthase
MTTAEDLINFTRETLKDKKFVVAIQRETYMHVHQPNNEITAKKTVGGVTTLLNAILRKSGGTLVAMAAGDADREVIDAKNRVLVPPGEESYTLKRVFLTKREQDHFYYGFANQTLWPLCHAVFEKPGFRESWWRAYIKINQRFANAILEEINHKDAFVWINDYHFALVPKMLREKRPNISIGIFWHIPWPTLEIFRACPWRHEILEGMLGADFIGFHRQYHTENFIDCLREEIGVIVESEPRSVLYQKRLTKITHLPSGIDIDEIDKKLAQQQNVDRSILAHELGISIQTKYLMIGVDRIDYTKGLIERFRIIERLLEKYPKYEKQITYLSIGVPSRLSIPAYKTYSTKVQKIITRINDKFRRGDWQPIEFRSVDQGVDRDRLFAYYRLADIGLITPLDDGMNLVAKEYVVSCQPDKGMLVLSRFAGAAKDLYASMLINPYDIEGSVSALHYALEMKPDEKILRNTEMRRVLEENNIYRWGIEFIKNSTTENLTHKYL